MNCILKVNDPTSQINHIFECTGDGWARYEIDTLSIRPKAYYVGRTVSDGKKETEYEIRLYTNDVRDASIVFDVEEGCEMLSEIIDSKVIVTLTAKRLILKQEEVYPNERIR